MNTNRSWAKKKQNGLGLPAKLMIELLSGPKVTHTLFPNHNLIHIKSLYPNQAQIDLVSTHSLECKVVCKLFFFANKTWPNAPLFAKTTIMI